MLLEGPLVISIFHSWNFVLLNVQALATNNSYFWEGNSWPLEGDESCWSFHPPRGSPGPLGCPAWGYTVLGCAEPFPRGYSGRAGDAAAVWDRKGDWGSGGPLLFTGKPARGGGVACLQVGLPDGEPGAKAGLSSERRLPRDSSVASDIQGGRRPFDLHTSDDSAWKEDVAATAHTQGRERMCPRQKRSISTHPAPGQLPLGWEAIAARP